MAETLGLSGLLETVRKLHRIQDPGILLERTLHTARTLVQADAGTLYTRSGNRLYFTYIENDTLFPDNRGEGRYAYANHSLPLDKTSLAGYAAQTGESLAVADAYNLPPGLEYSFNSELDEKTNYRTLSQLVVPIISGDAETLGVIQLINARQGDKTVSFSDADKTSITLLAHYTAPVLEKTRMAQEMVMRMVHICELSDPHETGNHARRVGEYSLLLYDHYAAARGVDLAERNQKKEAFRAAAIMHDIGKAGISTDILANDGHYSEEEMLIMYRHTVYGARLFSNPVSLWDQIAREVVLNHHERWDGSGYPGKIKDINVEPKRYGPGKRETEIPLSARIVAIADVYDALTSERSYKDSWPSKAALHYIKSKAGKLFDPELVHLFVKMGDRLEAIHKSFPPPPGHIQEVPNSD